MDAAESDRETSVVSGYALEQLTRSQLLTLLVVLGPCYGSHAGGTALYAEALLEAFRRRWVIIDAMKPQREREGGPAVSLDRVPPYFGKV